MSTIDKQFTATLHKREGKGGWTCVLWPDSVAYFDTKGASNGPTEAVNGVIETTRRIARGFRNFTHYRLRMLLSAGGHRPYRKKPPNHA